MHTFEASGGTRFHFNSDFSGNVVILFDGKKIEVPGDDLAELIIRRYDLRECRLEFDETPITPALLLSPISPLSPSAPRSQR